jgi:prevent-host-death family protein
VKSTYTITEAQGRFPRVVRESANAGAIPVTRHGETVAYIVSRERLEAMAETMEILANPRAMQAIRDYEAGRLAFKPLTADDAH